MDFINLAKGRYTTKMYDVRKKVSDADLNQLGEILRLSPSSINSQPWRFIVVSDEKLKAALAKVSYFNKAKIMNSSQLFVFTVMRTVHDFEAYMPLHLEAGSIRYYQDFLQNMGEEGIQSWLQHQVYISLGFFLSACASMLIDATPMEGIDLRKYDEILELVDYQTLFAVAIGYRDPLDSNQPSLKSKLRRPFEDVVHFK